MPTPVELPQLGNTVEECIITRWVKRDGDTVSAGEVIAEIETDKTSFELTAPVGGTILSTFFNEGALVPVFTNILVIGTPGEDVAPFRPAGAAPAKPSTIATKPAPVASPHPQYALGRGSVLAGARAPASAVAGRPATAFSPRASRLAAELDLPRGDIFGSGPGGRVLERDVRRAFDARRTDAPRPSVPEAQSPAADRGARTPAGAVSGLRATIARRMRESLATTAQYTLTSSADATGLLALRARVKARASDGIADITINDLVAFCAIQALLDVPDMNAEFSDGRILTHRAVHLAFAVDTPKGLLAPVVRSAHELSIGDLALRMKTLATQAASSTLPPDDLTGATFTISNLGSLGIESFTPLINPPQVAILGIGAIQLKPVRRKGRVESIRVRETSARRALALAESVEFVDAIGLSLTCDHQVIDGAPGARFLQVLRRKIEEVESLVDL
jgi:pyruvate dehydrogenase E2 component (dihydrolipoamide acetyltransferase)